MQRHREERICRMEAGWSDVPISPELPTPSETRKEANRFSCRASRRNQLCLYLDFRLPGSGTEMINCSHFKPPRLWDLLRLLEESSTILLEMWCFTHSSAVALFFHLSFKNIHLSGMSVIWLLNYFPMFYYWKILNCRRAERTSPWTCVSPLPRTYHLFTSYRFF